MTSFLCLGKRQGLPAWNPFRKLCLHLFPYKRTDPSQASTFPFSYFTNKDSLFLFHLYMYLLGGEGYHSVYIEVGGQFESWLSPFNMGIPGLKARSSGLVAIVFALWAIFLALNQDSRLQVVEDKNKKTKRGTKKKKMKKESKKQLCHRTQLDLRAQVWLPRLAMFYWPCVLYFVSCRGPWAGKQSWEDLELQGEAYVSQQRPCSNSHLPNLLDQETGIRCCSHGFYASFPERTLVVSTEEYPEDE